MRSRADPQGLTFGSAAEDYERGRTGWPPDVVDGVDSESVATTMNWFSTTSHARSTGELCGWKSGIVTNWMPNFAW